MNNAQLEALANLYAKRTDWRFHKSVTEALAKWLKTKKAA